MILVRHGQSHFNVAFGATRKDPGLVDPGLTDEGRRQARDAGGQLSGRGLRRIVSSPYSRTLETAAIIAERLALPVTVDTIVGERAFYTCDIGSPCSRLAATWPAVDFGDLTERWWPEPEETEAQLLVRCEGFRRAMAALDDWRHVLVVTHWGFIRGLTGQEVANAAIVPYDPTPAAAAAT